MNGNTIQIEIKLKDDGTIKGIQQLGDQGEKTGKQLDKSFKGAGNTIGDFNKKILGAGGVIAGITAAAYAAKKIIDIADGWTLVEGRLKLVTSSSAQLARVQEDLFNLSQETRQQYEATADLYGRLARSTEQLNVTDRQRLQVTEAINKSMIVSGATATESGAAIIQLSQGLASGALRGDELRSVLEQTPRLAKAIAEGLGASIGELRLMGEAGELTAEKVFGALLDQSDKINDEFKQMPMTVGQSITKINNSFGKLISGSDKSLSATEALAGGISGVASAIDDLAGYVESFLSIGGVFGLDAGDMGLIGASLFGGGPGLALIVAAGVMTENAIEKITGQDLSLIGILDSLSGFDAIAEQTALQREAYQETARLAEEMASKILAPTVFAAAPTEEELAAIAKANDEIKKFNQELSDDIKGLAMGDYEYKTWLLGQEIINLQQKATANKQVQDDIREYEALKTLEIEQERMESDRKLLSDRLGEYQKFYDDLGKQIAAQAEKEKANILELNSLYKQQMDLRRGTEDMIAELGGTARDAADQYKTTLAELDQQFAAAGMLGGQDQINALEQYKQGIAGLAEEFANGFDKTSGADIAGDAIKDIEAAYQIQKQVMAGLTTAAEEQIETNKTWGQELQKEAAWAAEDIAALQGTINDLDSQMQKMDKTILLAAEDGISSVIGKIQSEVDALHELASKPITITTNYVSTGGGGGTTSTEPAAYVLDSFATGSDYVPETGPYLLHEGESVKTAAENRAVSSGAGGFSMTGDINIYVPESAAPMSATDWRQTTRDQIIPQLKEAGFGKN